MEIQDVVFLVSIIVFGFIVPYYCGKYVWDGPDLSKDLWEEDKLKYIIILILTISLLTGFIIFVFNVIKNIV